MIQWAHCLNIWSSPQSLLRSRAVQGVCLLERPPPITTTPPMTTGCPLIPPSLTSPLTGGMEAEEVEVTGVVVTPMKLAPPEGGKRKRMGFQVRSKSLNLEVRRVILIMWPTPLGSGPVVSLITRTIEDSYLMPLVVSSLTGDTSDVFD